ncbi:MAG: hypothetical protein NTV88_06315 [Candidatus Micrarchaeota archaeon]|nr:hypothetical protein [Candidatus Micrarchaeota archaeon]
MVMAPVSAFCPSYVTGLFTIEERDACGAGFTINKGLTTTVSKLNSGRTKITVNGIESPAPVSKAVLRRFAERCGNVGLLEIKHETEIPIGYGLGMSAAGALSLSLALNELFGAGFSKNECVKIAHDADVECGTGLSGVDASAIGGMLARKSVSDKPVALKFEEKELEIAFFAPIRTANIIRDDSWKKKVNIAGTGALEMLFKKKNYDSLIDASRQFTIDSGLGSWCGGEMENNPRASMAMIGQTLFSDSPMALSRPPVNLLKVKTAKKGAVLL